MTTNEIMYVNENQVYLKIEDQKEAYLEHCLCAKRLSMNTVSAYEIDLSQFIDYLKDEYPDVVEGSQITKVILQNYIQVMSQTLAVSSTKRKIAALKGFFNWMVDEELICGNPFGSIRLRMKEPKRLPNTMSLVEIKRVLKAVYDEKNSSTDFLYWRDIAILEVLFGTGIRVQELCDLKYSDYDSKNGSLRIVGKGNKERHVFLADACVFKALENYMRLVKKYRIKNEYIFLSKYSTKLSTQAVRNLVKKYTKLAKINRKITPHAFRHSFASLLLAEGVDLKHIQEFLGHSSINTTQIYLHLDDEHSKKLLRKKHPRNKMKF